MHSELRHRSLCSNWCRPFYGTLSRINSRFAGLEGIIGRHAAVRLGFIHTESRVRFTLTTRTLLLCIWNRDNSMDNIEAAAWTTVVSEFSPGQMREIFIFFQTFRPALESTQPPLQGVTGLLSAKAVGASRCVDHPHPSIAEVKERVDVMLLFILLVLHDLF